VVDDDRDVRDLLSTFIEAELGLHASEAEDGADALEVICNSLPALVLTDIRMPKMDGWELLTHLRSMSPPVPTLLMLGYDVHIGANGMSEMVLAKPFRPEQLTNLIRQMLAGEQPQSA
jgi:CheY-like chemotaxis protein